MSVIEKNIKLRGSKGEAEKAALFDSGASYSCIRKELAEKLGIVEALPEPRRFATAQKDHVIKETHRITIDFYINGDRFSDEFMVIEDLSDEVIIGAKTLQAWRMRLDFENDDVVYDPRVTKLRLCKSRSGLFMLFF